MSGKHIVVVGAARSGAATARFARSRGARVTLSDQAPAASLGDVPAKLAAQGVSLELGGHHSETFMDADLVVLSPGVPHTIAPLEAARRRGVPVIGELELASRYLRAPMVAVTGTNGKTTVTRLIAEMLSASQKRVFVGGNIGEPLIGLVHSGRTVDVVVVEVSSFQLDTADAFHPGVAVLLNISPDHLDRYDDFQAYARAKTRIFKRQTSADTAVLNGADPMVRAMAEAIAATRVWFSGRPPGAPGADMQGSHLVLNGFSGLQDKYNGLRIDLSPLRLIGPHNRANAAAAALAALSAGADPAGIAAALAAFAPLSHRLTPVAEIDGVRYVDDSKATNVDAVCQALAAFQCPVVLIAGGKDKGGGYDALKSAVNGKVRRLIVLGEAADTIAAQLGPCCQQGAVHAADMHQAVALARASARRGDVVLLSPACSSFDMFSDYAHRGRVFAAAVGKLER